MARQTFSERNRRRREALAVETLHAYALSAGISEPKRSAERAAKALHAGGDAPSPRGASARMGRPAVAADRGGADAADADRVPHRLEDRTKEQLYTRAQELDIAGRSQMSKDELIDAIRASQ
jgi:hypothetical protein